MFSMRAVVSLILWVFLLALPGRGQPVFSGAAELDLAIGRLNVVGKVLMIAAHPDDENTALLAWWARGRKLSTGYLSLTRGEGGQNLIGSEQGPLMGITRTQELLSARRIDGARQFFTRAIDFGFSKTPREALEQWGREETLADVVWVIRKFRPDVIILRFSGTPRDGHGQHQASAILGKEAFEAAADPARFPEQLQWVQPWRAKRVVWNIFAFTPEMAAEAARMPNTVKIDPGRFDPILGYSFREIAGMSRSEHRSQGMGAPQPKGSDYEYLAPVAGDPASQDLFDGVDLSWSRVPGSSAAAQRIAEAVRDFRLHDPSASVKSLLAARTELLKLEHPLAKEKLSELEEAIALASGLWLEARSPKPVVTPGSVAPVQLLAVNRSALEVSVESAEITSGASRLDAPAARKLLEQGAEVSVHVTFPIPAGRVYSQPYWLREPPLGARYQIPDQRLTGLPENPAWLEARFRVRIEDQVIEYLRPVEHYEVDVQVGEKRKPLALMPPLSVEMAEPVLLFPTQTSRNITVRAQSQASAEPSGVVNAGLDAPAGWSVEPESRQLKIAKAGEQDAALFRISAPSTASDVPVKGLVSEGGHRYADTIRILDYPHIPAQTLLIPAVARAIRTDIQVLSKNVAYVMGAGDEIPKALEQLGCRVTLLDDSYLATGDLSGFDAIVAGIRAYNTRPALAANRARLLEYVAAGGTYIVQYNVLPFRRLRPNEPDPLSDIGPYPLKISRERVTVEDVPVKLLEEAHPVLTSPNRLTRADFEGWVQERGLYFAVEWDPRYTPLFEAADPGEGPLRGSTLYTKYGKGAYVFTALSWFRQLPAGVPGAYRIFANLLSAGKTAP